MLTFEPKGLLRFANLYTLMECKYNLKEAKRRFSFAWRDIPYNHFTCPKRRFISAKKSNTEAVSYIGTAMSHVRQNDQIESISEWQNLLCEASFGKGLAEGLLELKEKTYKNRHRSFQELELVIRDFNRAYMDLTLEPRYPESHLKIGKGFGCLGLAKEGKNMLEKGIYWDKIKEYLFNKQL